MVLSRKCSNIQRPRSRFVTYYLLSNCNSGCTANLYKNCNTPLSARVVVLGHVFCVREICVYLRRSDYRVHCTSARNGTPCIAWGYIEGARKRVLRDSIQERILELPFPSTNITMARMMTDYVKSLHYLESITIYLHVNISFETEYDLIMHVSCTCLFGYTEIPSPFFLFVGNICPEHIFCISFTRKHVIINHFQLLFNS